MTDPVLILTMKWGTLYGPEDVNRLARQVRHHLRRPHRFICFTDDGAGIGEGVETRPLPELRLPDGSADTRWRKLALFNPDLGGFGGATALFLDLDLIVVDDLAPFFDLGGDFLILRDDDAPAHLLLLTLRGTRLSGLGELRGGVVVGLLDRGARLSLLLSLLRFGGVLGLGLLGLRLLHAFS